MKSILLLAALAAPDVYQLPHEAVAAARADARAAFDEGKPTHFYRFVHNPSLDRKKAGPHCYAVNEAITRGDLIIHPKLFANGAVLRWDFFLLAGGDETVAKSLLKIWDKFADDEPYFLTEIIEEFRLPPGGVKILESTSTHHLVEMDKPFQQDGKTYTAKWFSKGGTTGKRDFSPAVGLDAAEELAELTGTRVPIVRIEWVTKRLLTTIERGLYYEFRGIKKNPAKGTAQEAFLATFGADEADSDESRSILEGLMEFSGVTGKERRWRLIRGRRTKVSESQGLVGITQDIKDDEVDPDFDPFKNAKKSKFDATEIIAELPNGLHAYGLFDGKGALQDAAPDNIVKDHTIPVPYTARLQCAISCIRCHNMKEQNGGAGWKAQADDFRVINAKRLDVYGEKSRLKGVDPKDTFILAGRHAGDILKPLVRGRDDYTDAVVRCAPDAEFQETADGLTALYNDYWYTRIDAAVACREIGEAVPEGVKAEDHLLSVIALPPVPDGIIEEHPTFGALYAGLSVSRLRWEEVYGQAVFRKLEKKRLAR